MSQADNSNADRNANARRRIIEDAQQLCHYMRAQCQEQRSFHGEVPEEYRVEFQNAIANYYWALRPLRTTSVIEDWWQSIELSKHWTDASSGEAYCGLNLITDVNRLTETVEYEKKSMRGREIREEERTVVLPYAILEDLSGVLDDAAAKLGFTIETPTPVEEDPLPV